MAAASRSSSSSPLLLVDPARSSIPLSSAAKTFANLILCIVETGVLGLPYTFKCVGWLLGLLILAFSGFIAYYGMMLIVWSKRRLQSIRSDLTLASYGDLLFYTFGRAGRMTVDVLLLLSTIACGISYFTFISQNLASIASTIQQTGDVVTIQAPAAIDSHFPGHLESLAVDLSWTSSSIYAWMIFPFEVALAAIPSITYLAPMSAVADALNFCALLSVMVSDVVAIRTAGLQAVRAIGQWIQVPSALGVAIYAFQSAAMMIPIEAAMQKPATLGRVPGLAFLLIGVLYAAFAGLGYGAFGDDTQQIITLNLEEGMEAILIKLALCVGLFFAFPLMLNPMCEVVERRFSNRKHSLLLRALVVGLICVLATTVKKFTDFLSLAGSSISTLLGFIIPAAVHLKVSLGSEERVPIREIVADYCLIAVGVLFGVVGTTISFLNLL